MEVVNDYIRGCGSRKKGGIYLVAPRLGSPCGKLPIVLGHPCRTYPADLLDVLVAAGYVHVAIEDLRGIDLGCGQLVWDVEVDGKVIKQSRSYRKLENPAPLFNSQNCKNQDNQPTAVTAIECQFCPLEHWPSNEPVLLDWIGKQHYPTADHFEHEAGVLGVSRRMRHLPEWFVVGKTWVALAHEYVVPLSDTEVTEHVQFLPAIFKMFKPVRAEVVCDGTETDEELAEYRLKGLVPVKVNPLGEHPMLSYD